MSKAKFPLEFIDSDGDSLEIDRKHTDHPQKCPALFFCTRSSGVFVKAADVNKIRKTLKAWLIEVGEIKPKLPVALGDGLTVVLTFAPEDLSTVLAVTLQDADGHVLNTLWER